MSNGRISFHWTNGGAKEPYSAVEEPEYEPVLGLKVTRRGHNGSMLGLITEVTEGDYACTPAINCPKEVIITYRYGSTSLLGTDGAGGSL